MRKIVAVFLLLTVVTVFVSCGKDDDVTTTQSTTESTAQTTAVQTMAYVLTTNPNKKAPWKSTTRFEIGIQNGDSSSDTTGSIGDINLTGGSIEKPGVNMSAATTLPTTSRPTSPSYNTPSQQQPQKPSQNKPSVNNTTKKETTKKQVTTKESTTAAVVKKPVSLVVNSEAVNNDSERIIIEIDNSAWTGDIKANSKNIPVQVDGIALEGTVPLKVTSGKNAGGNQEIILDLSGKNVGSGSTVSFTIPEGFLETSNGAQYNSSYSASSNY